MLGLQLLVIIVHCIVQVTTFRSPVTVEERVAVTVWKLATNIEHRKLSNLFGLGQSTVGKIVVETCRVITMYLLPQYVYVPSGEKLKVIVDGFETCWGFPQLQGPLMGHIFPSYALRIVLQTTIIERGIFHLCARVSRLFYGRLHWLARQGP